LVKQPLKHHYSFLMNKSRRLWKVKPTKIRCCVDSMESCVAAIGIGESFFFVALWPMGSSFMRFLDHTQRRTTFSRTPLDEWPIRRRDLYLTTHITNKRKTSIPPAGFEPTISAGKRPQTYTLYRAATGIGLGESY
jgi:hypothetical protein